VAAVANIRAIRAKKKDKRETRLQMEKTRMR
jgi:hypothetical protein